MVPCVSSIADWWRRELSVGPLLSQGEASLPGFAVAIGTVLSVDDAPARDKEGEAGRRRITRYTRYATIVPAAFQAMGVAFALESQQAGSMAAVMAPG